LRHLSNLRCLQRLILAGCPITDKGLSHLKRCTKLKSLDVSQTKITSAGMTELRKALPDLRIDHFSYSQ
jgi:hypothetical protein